MHGAVFGVFIVAVAVVLIVGVTPFLLIPIVVVALGAWIAVPMLAATKDTNMRPTGAGPSGRPSTREASYDPRSDATRHA